MMMMMVNTKMVMMIMMVTKDITAWRRSEPIQALRADFNFMHKTSPPPAAKSGMHAQKEGCCFHPSTKSRAKALGLYSDLRKP
jgi:hypothetical protein